MQKVIFANLTIVMESIQKLTASKSKPVMHQIKILIKR
jgi:hypothetical protein